MVDGIHVVEIIFCDNQLLLLLRLPVLTKGVVSGANVGGRKYRQVWRLRSDRVHIITIFFCSVRRNLVTGGMTELRMSR